MAPTGIANGIGIGPFGGRAPFLPTDIAGAVLWLPRPVDGVNCTTVGGDVTVWQNQVGAVDATSGLGSNEPSFSATGGPGGGSGVAFDRANTESLALIGLGTYSGDFTFGCSLKLLATTANQFLFNSFNAGDLAVLSATNTSKNGVYCAPAGFYSTAEASFIGDQILIWTYNGTTGAVDVYVDGANVGSLSVGTGLVIHSRSDVANNTLGRYRGSDAFHLDGVLGEFVIYNQELSAGNIAQLTAYLGK